jgi:hypothetical protein
MSRQYFSDVIIDPPLANLTAITSTSETNWWNIPQFSPIHAFDSYRGAGKIFRLSAGGIYSTSTVAPTLILNYRVGTSATPGTNISLGVSVTQTLPASLTNEPWFLQAILVVRSIGAPGANSTVIGTANWQGGGAAATAGSGPQIAIGGTQASVDLSIESGLCISGTWSTTATNSITPQWVVMQSLN